MFSVDKLEFVRSVLIYLYMIFGPFSAVINYMNPNYAKLSEIKVFLFYNVQMFEDSDRCLSIILSHSLNLLLSLTMVCKVVN